MKRLKKLMYFIFLLIGLFLIAGAIVMVTGISVTRGGTLSLPLNGASAISALTIEGDTVTTTADDSWLVFDIPRNMPVNYIELNIGTAQYAGAAADEKTAQVFYTDKAGEFVEDRSVKQELKNGRNFIAIPTGYYSSIRIDLTNYVDAVFQVKAINLTKGLPLRLRHLIAFVFWGVLWGIVCWVLFFYRLSLIVLRLQGFRKYSYLLFNLVKKDFTTKYRRSVLGILWSVLNPLLMAMIISAVFSQIFRIQMENFAAYYLTGILVFNLMSEATNGSLASVLGAAGLIKKVYIPKYIFPLEKCLFALVNTIFTLIATLILMPFLGVALRPTILLFWVPMAYVLIFSIGLGLLLSAANIFFRDVGHLYGVWITAWMYLTPILYPAELIPDSVKWFINANPMYYYVSCFRDVMMYDTIPDFKTNVICAAFAGAFLIIGVIVFKKTQDRFILYV